MLDASVQGDLDIYIPYYREYTVNRSTLKLVPKAISVFALGT